MLSYYSMNQTALTVHLNEFCSNVVRDKDVGYSNQTVTDSRDGFIPIQSTEGSRIAYSITERSIDAAW